MVEIRIIPLLLLLLLASLSCVSQKRGRKARAAAASTYEEDLSFVRMEHEELPAEPLPPPVSLPPSSQPPSSEVRRRVDEALENIAELNKEKRYLNGYTIQVYAGQNRQEAILAKSKIVKAINEGEDRNFEVLLQYTQPTFVVSTGAYFSRLGAQRDLYYIQQHFPKAILVPSQLFLW